MSNVESSLTRLCKALWASFIVLSLTSNSSWTATQSKKTNDPDDAEKAKYLEEEAVNKKRAAYEEESNKKWEQAQAQFKKTIETNPDLSEEDFPDVVDYIHYTIDQDKLKLLVKRKKAEEQAKIKFNTMKISNPDALDEDFDQIFSYQTLTINEDDLKKRIATRKSWLAQYKDSTIDDFNFFENYPFVEQNKPGLQKHLSGKANWLKQHPGKDLTRDYHSLWVRGQGFGEHPIQG